MEETFHNHFTNDHEMLYYEASYQSRNAKDKIPLMIKNQEILKENIGSPEFNIFHMASPDLERLIVGQSAETSHNRETTTINSSDLNVLNLVSPDFEKIFSNFNDKDLGQRDDFNKRRSVQKQHEVYTKTFVDALQKIRQKEDTNKNSVGPSRERSNEKTNVNYLKGQHPFLQRKTRNEHNFLTAPNHISQDNNVNQFHPNFGNIALASTGDRNKNKIVDGLTDGNRNTIRSNHYHQTSDHHFSNSGNTGVGSSERDRNVIHPNYVNQTNPCNLNPEVNLDTHPDLFKLHAHAKLSENLRDNMEQLPPGHQEVHTSPQMFPLPPIDLQVQEIVKRERKKQKNRVAASKCRKKKLEREAQLEVRVQQLRERNIELTTIASALKNQLNDLKQHVMEHIACGCHVTAY